MILNLLKNIVQTRKHPQFKFGSTQYLPIFIDRINRSLTSLTYHQANIGLFTGLICATIIWLRLHHTVSLINLDAWFAMIIFVTLARITLVKIYFLQDNPEAHVKYWRNLFIIGSTLAGICWGSLSLMILPYIDSSNEVLVLMILAGVTAGAVAFVAGILTAAFLFLATALLPLAIYYIFIKSSMDILMGTTVTVYLAFLLIQARKVHFMLQNGLLLQFELNEAKNQLEKTATHDALTKVANRNLFNIKFKEALENAKKNHTKVALLYLDLNKFKMINDIYGHHIGDQVLLIFVERLKTLFKEDDMISRLGGDEFTVILDRLSKEKNVDTIAQEVDQVLAAPAYINNQKIDIRASLGVSIYPTHGLDPETLLRVADTEMYSAKRALTDNKNF
jgi:diguanylate cyclase (GGDEF)-like protein